MYLLFDDSVTFSYIIISSPNSKTGRRIKPSVGSHLCMSYGHLIWILSGTSLKCELHSLGLRAALLTCVLLFYLARCHPLLRQKKKL